MKKRQIRLAAIMMSAMVVLTGCGLVAPLYEMTDDERDIVVHYAAYVVGKHNIYQKDGMTNANPQEWLEEQEDTPEEIAEETADTDTSSSNAGGAVQSQANEPQKKLSLAESIGVKGKASVIYQGHRTSDSYQEGSYYSLNTVVGKKFLILNFTIKNTSSKEIKVDAFSKNPMYAVSVDGKDAIQAEQTFLTYSLSTYQGKLKSGDSVDVVLLFEVPAEQAEKVKDITLTVRQKGVNYLVEL